MNRDTTAKSIPHLYSLRGNNAVAVAGTPINSPNASRALLAAFALLALAAAACAGSVSPISGAPEFPLVACPIDVPGAPTAPSGYTLVAPGTIVFTQDAWHNVSGGDPTCGAQAVRGATSLIAFSSLGGEDTIFWAATLARPGQPTTPDPVLPTMTLVRLDPGGPVVVDTETQEPFNEYRMDGRYGHDAQPGAYLMQIVSSNGNVLAEGRFEIVN